MHECEHVNYLHVQVELVLSGRDPLYVLLDLADGAVILLQYAHR
jgi:hypothetical protein